MVIFSRCIVSVLIFQNMYFCRSYSSFTYFVCRSLGLGSLCMPYSFKQVGVVTGLLLSFIAGFTFTYSFTLLVRAQIFSLEPPWKVTHVKYVYNIYIMWVVDIGWSRKNTFRFLELKYSHVIQVGYPVVTMHRCRKNRLILFYVSIILCMLTHVHVYVCR